MRPLNDGPPEKVRSCLYNLTTDHGSSGSSQTFLSDDMSVVGLERVNLVDFSMPVGLMDRYESPRSCFGIVGECDPSCSTMTSVESSAYFVFIRN